MIVVEQPQAIYTSGRAICTQRSFVCQRARTQHGVNWATLSDKQGERTRELKIFLYMLMLWLNNYYWNTAQREDATGSCEQLCGLAENRNALLRAVQQQHLVPWLKTAEGQGSCWSSRGSMERACSCQMSRQHAMLVFNYRT
jgi:hypothetical protein